MTPRYSLVVCDIDGCLSPESNEPMDVQSLALVAAHNRRAESHRDRPVLTLCSGRPQPFAEAMARLVHNSTTPIVCENGAWLYHPGTNVYQLDPAITTGHLDAVEQARRWLHAEFGPRGVTQQPGKIASISLYHPDPGYLRSIRGPIEARFARESWPMRVSMTWFYVNCDLSHVSKGSGLARLTSQLGLARSQLAGIGDTLSDKPIADAVAFFACPANAAPDIKPLAHYVSPLPQTRGVLDILDRIADTA